MAFGMFMYYQLALNLTKMPSFSFNFTIYRFSDFLLSSWTWISRFHLCYTSPTLPRIFHHRSLERRSTCCRPSDAYTSWRL